MVRAHYALVEDLFSPEEFEVRVEETLGASGDLLDERTAAMIVVREAGRSHLKICDLHKGAKMVSFFCKVISKGSLQEFTRSDDSKGVKIRLICGDETGEAGLVLWDERVKAAEEIEPGWVLEVIGRVGSGREIHVVDMQQCACEIAARKESGSVAADGEEHISLDACILWRGEEKTFTRRDGTPGQRIDIFGGDTRGVFRLVFWDPLAAEDLCEGAKVHIEGLRLSPLADSREYTAGDDMTITFHTDLLDIPFDSVAGAVIEGESGSFEGQIVSMESPRQFVTRRGEDSWVRNCRFSDVTGEIALVIWGDAALSIPGGRTPARVLNARVRKGRGGALELHLTRASALVFPDAGSVYCEYEGTVLRMGTKMCIDNGNDWYLLEGMDLPFGVDHHISGVLKGNTMYAKEAVPLVLSRFELSERIKKIGRDE